MNPYKRWKLKIAKKNLEADYERIFNIDTKDNELTTDLKDFRLREIAMAWDLITLEVAGIPERILVHSRICPDVRLAVPIQRGELVEVMDKLKYIKFRNTTNYLFYPKYKPGYALQAPVPSKDIYRKCYVS